MNIKEAIGRRIAEARKDKGLTMKALANLTEDLKQSRINNWECGIRTPGPQEIKQLAKVLDVSPAFLMCLTDEKQNKKNSDLCTFVPLLDHKQACNAEEFIKAIRDNKVTDQITFIPVNSELAAQLGKYTFALKMLDSSMIQEIRIDDIQIVDPSASPKPGDYVVVKIKDKSDAIICQYKQLSYTSSEFELLTLNDTWPNIRANEATQVKIIGKIIQNIRTYA